MIDTDPYWDDLATEEIFERRRIVVEGALDQKSLFEAMRQGVPLHPLFYILFDIGQNLYHHNHLLFSAVL